AYPAFRECIQIGTAGWQAERLNAGGPKRVLKGSTELAVAIVQNKTDRKQATVDVIDGPASHLHHPFLGWMLGDSGQGDAAPLQGQEEQNIIVCEPRQLSTSTVKKSMLASTAMCERMKSAQLICWRRLGAGAIPNLRRMFPTV